ncbi:MAG: GNAT family N-acetyltransferase [Rhodospirillales bacterium]|jgi:ribosomal-protein-alanine N-acetyltransferase|nr:GNAT family N-acetyltransferase [Rhodospirillales bacterium]
MIPANLAAAAAMAAIHAESFPAGEAWDGSAFAAQLAQPGVFGRLDPQGGLVLARIAGDEAEILTLGVVPASRRRGLGRALLAAALAEAAARGARRVFLEVAVANQPALALYAAAGFTPVGRRRGYYADGQDALVLSAVLSPPAAATGG